MSPADLGHCGTVSKADGQLPRPCSGFWSRCSVPSSPGLVGQKGSLDQECLILQKWRKEPRDPGGGVRCRTDLAEASLMSLLLYSGFSGWDCPSTATESVKESSEMTPDELPIPRNCPESSWPTSAAGTKPATLSQSSLSLSHSRGGKISSKLSVRLESGVHGVWLPGDWLLWEASEVAGDWLIRFQLAIGLPLHL